MSLQSVTSPNLLKLTLQMQRLENKRLVLEVNQLHTELQKSSVEISKDIHTDFIKIFSDNLDKQNIPPFMKLFWQEQQKYLSSSKTGIRYHPMIIRYAIFFSLCIFSQVRNIPERIILISTTGLR